MVTDIDDLIAYRTEDSLCAKVFKTQNRPNCIYAARNCSNLRLIDKAVTISYAELFGKESDNLFAIVIEYSNHEDCFEYTVGCFVDLQNKTEGFLKKFREEEFSDLVPDGQFIDMFFVDVKFID